MSERSISSRPHARIEAGRHLLHGHVRKRIHDPSSVIREDKVRVLFRFGLEFGFGDEFPKVHALAQRLQDSNIRACGRAELPICEQETTVENARLLGKSLCARNCCA